MKQKRIKAILVILFFLMFSFSCISEEMVTITKHFGDIRTEQIELPVNTKALELYTDFFEAITKLEGLDKLKNLKFLFIQHSVEDLSFLKKMVNLEVLVIIQPALDLVFDIDFISKLEKIKILYIETLTMKGDTINLINNKKLEYLFLGSISSDNKEGFFELKLENIPDTLKCLDLSLAQEIIINEKFMKNLIDIPLILLFYSKSAESIFELDNNFLERHPNIHITNTNKIRPKELNVNYLYDLAGIEQ